MLEPSAPAPAFSLPGAHGGEIDEIPSLDGSSVGGDGAGIVE